MAIERLHDQENVYERWLDANVGGYVFNHFGGRDAGFNVVHRASCSYLRRQKDEGRRTRVPKICASDFQELVSPNAVIAASRNELRKNGLELFNTACTSLRIRSITSRLLSGVLSGIIYFLDSLVEQIKMHSLDIIALVK